MEKEIKKTIKEIQKKYRNKLKTNTEIFYHLLDKVKEHVDKLTKLKEKDGESELFKREVADIYLLTLGLIELEKIDNKTIKESSQYYLKKIKKIFTK
ncbi:MAG: hypothetical protein ABIH59_02460 [archaeon]